MAAESPRRPVCWRNVSAPCSPSSPGPPASARRSARMLLDRDQPSPGERTEALLLAADRAQHVTEVIRPALDRGDWVVTDRFSASTLAYQGYGRGLDREGLDRLIEWATGGLTADVTVLVDVPLEVGRARRLGICRGSDGKRG